MENNMENLYVKNHIRTHSGIYIDPINPAADKITIEDIAWGLSMIPRFLGHTLFHFSVAQHSVNVLNDVRCFTEDKRVIMSGLLHDASEAYLCDIPSPIKHRIPGYLQIENNFMQVVADKFGFDWPLSNVVKLCDKERLEYEWDRWVLGTGRRWDGDDPISPILAYEMFMDEFKSIS